jgi:hypothetical protein
VISRTHRILVVAALVAASAIGCTRGAGDAHDLAVSSADAARDVVAVALRDVARGDITAVLSRFCDASTDGRERTRDVLQPILGRGDLTVNRVEPAWVGAEPYFFVEVKAEDGGWLHGFGVRVRDGCLDRAVGASRPPNVDNDVVDNDVIDL